MFMVLVMILIFRKMFTEDFLLNFVIKKPKKLMWQLLSDSQEMLSAFSKGT
jgi:hypothetical protein